MAELYHYGIPGMKWGVRRTKEQIRHDLDSRKAKNVNSPVIIAERNGLISLRINNKQLRHVKGSKAYTKGRSYVYNHIDMQMLINDLAGTGTPLPYTGVWNHKERVSSSRPIGVYIPSNSKKRSKTNNLIISYSKNGAHAVPARP